MALTLGELLTQVRDRLAESTAAQWSDPQLRRWINEGSRDIARRTESLLDRDDVSVTASTQEYAAPTDAIRLHRVEWRPTGSDQVHALEYRDIQASDEIWGTFQEVNEGTPVLYGTWGFPPNLKIRLWPIPSEAGSLKVFYYRAPTELATDGTADASSVEIWTGWEDVLADYCEFRALRRDRDPRWVEAKGMYDEKLVALFDASRRAVDQTGMIVSDSGAMVPGWLANPYW